jgi:D-xylonolactonase
LKRRFPEAPKPHRTSNTGSLEEEFMQQMATGYSLIEAPIWDANRGLYFSDVLNGGVHLLGKDGKISTVLPKRRGIGGMALHANGGLVVGGRDIALVDLSTFQSKSLLTAEAIKGATGFNDLTTDKSGRIYVGSLAYKVFGEGAPIPGHLHMIDLDGTGRSISDGVMLTNGMGFSPDGRRLYHSDAGSALVRVYDIQADGTVGPWRTFANVGPAGVPDGLKVASDGSVWVADAHGGRVMVFEANGSHRMDLPVPLPMVTSLCFGGDDLCDLYIVTGSRNAPSETSGSIFQTRVTTPGLALYPARVSSD